jgi:hypothetical protein
MTIRFSQRDIQIGAAYEEFKKIAAAQIRSAHGESIPVPLPSESALSVYSDLVAGVEAQTAAEEESLGEQF